MRSELASGNSLPASRLNQIVGVCDRFEAAWRAGTPHAIEDDLQGVTEDLRPHLLGALLGLGAGPGKILPILTVPDGDAVGG